MIDYHEEARLDALRQTGLLDAPDIDHLDRITRLARQIFGLEQAAISLTDRDRQRLKSAVGFDFDSMARSRAPCAEVTRTGAPLVIADMAADSVYATSPAALDGVRFYAGAPLITRDGFVLGALFVAGHVPRQVSMSELAALVDLAMVAIRQIEADHALNCLDRITGLPTQGRLLDDLDTLARDGAGEHRFCVLLTLGRDDQIETMASVLGGARVDEMAREAAVVLRGALGAERQLYHVAATQFAFLSTPGWDEVAYVRMLQVRLEELCALSPVRFVTSMTLGVRPFVVGETLPTDVLRGAMAAAQDAKRINGGVALFCANRDVIQRRQYGLLDDFGAALSDPDQFYLVYQPRVELVSGRCIGAEALLRWRHPVLGDISPAEFIPIVEHTSLARAMTQWVLDNTLDRLADWSDRGIDLTVSMNLSAVNLVEADLVSRIQSGLSARQLRPEQLEMELTESAIMDRPDQSLAVLHTLAATGTRLAIDDFGTGQSGLAYLQQLPACVMKIDRTFVQSLAVANGPGFVLVDAMIGLGHRLGFRVVAEGIETAAAAAILTRAGCEEGQGYFFARPMAAGAFERWLEEADQSG